MIYKVSSTKQLHFSDPLHVGRFYPHAQRVHQGKMQERQDLILYLASIHEAAIKSGMPRGFCRIPMRLTSLKEWVHDYKGAFNHFFTIVESGYHIGDEWQYSVIIPNELPRDPDFEPTERKLVYVPPPVPAQGVVSKVFVQVQKKELILKKLATNNRLDLYAPVEWLLSQPTNEFNFYFIPSGKLQMRDTSIWPIAAIETWPSWLREDLFGPGIDIEAAYTQFLIEGVRKAYEKEPDMVRILYPDLLRSLEDKTQWRREICEDVLGMEWNDHSVGVVKKICMSLANGSKISPGILLSEMGHSMTRNIILEESADVTASKLIHIGQRLLTISRQYSAAKKVVCRWELGLAPTRANQKKVFAGYFEWEREARYKIWESVGRHGIMVHDGIDGIPEEELSRIPEIISSLNLKLTRS